MDRRQFLLGTTGLLATLAGCTGGDSTEEEPTEGTPDSDTTTEKSGAGTTTESETETTIQSDSETETSTAEAAYTVRVSFDGEWKGSISAGGSSKSIEGTGSENFTVTGDPFVVAANAQKQSDGDGELTVQILQDGEVVGEESTTASYGVAQVTSESGSDISGDSDSTTAGGEDSGASSTEDTFAFKVLYDGEWQGSISAGGSSKSIEGTGTKTVSIDGSPDIISGNAQKQDDSSAKLTVQILNNGEVVKETSTTAEYGVAQVSYSSF